MISSIFIITFLYAQDESSELRLNTEVEAHLGSGQTHSYHLSMDEEMFVFAMLNQIGIDLKITAIGPDGEEIGEFDSPNGTNGPEPISFNSDKNGIYKLVIAPLNEDGDDKGEEGNYTIKLLRLEPVAQSKEGKVDQLFAAWDNIDGPGASVAVMQNGEVIFSNGYGAANLEYGIANSAQTVFHIASISKQFTAFAIVLLAEQRKLSLDEDIRKYLPEMHEFEQVITVRHLIHHTSGLRDQWNLLVMAGWRFDDVITEEQIMKLLYKQEELNFAPGAEHMYCNSGYTMMAQIVEKVTGESFADWTHEHIFSPLGMNNTLFYDDHEKIVANRAYSYHTSSGEYKKSVLNYANVGATSLFTTVEDLCKWAWNFENITVGSEEIMQTMHTRGILNNGDTINYAFGQVITEYKGHRAVNHGGADAGYRTFLGRLPDQKMAVVIFSNFASFNPGGYALQIADIYLGTNEESEDSNDVEGSENNEEPEKSEEYVEVAEEILEEYYGNYELAPGFSLRIFKEDSIIYAQATGQSRIKLLPRSNVEFFAPEATGTAVVTFERNDAGEVHQLSLDQGGSKHIAPRIGLFDPETIDLSDYIGIYYSPELSTTYEFVVEENELVVKHSRHEDFSLTASKADIFTGSVWYFQLIEMIRQDDEITGFTATNGRVRNLRFDKVD